MEDSFLEDFRKIPIGTKFELEWTECILIFEGIFDNDPFNQKIHFRTEDGKHEIGLREDGAIFGIDNEPMVPIHILENSLGIPVDTMIWDLHDALKDIEDTPDDTCAGVHIELQGNNLIDLTELFKNEEGQKFYILGYGMCKFDSIINEDTDYETISGFKPKLRLSFENQFATISLSEYGTFPGYKDNAPCVVYTHDFHTMEWMNKQYNWKPVNKMYLRIRDTESNVKNGLEPGKIAFLSIIDENKEEGIVYYHSKVLQDFSNIAEDMESFHDDFEIIAEYDYFYRDNVSKEDSEEISYFNEDFEKINGYLPSEMDHHDTEPKKEEKKDIPPFCEHQVKVLIEKGKAEELLRDKENPLLYLFCLNDTIIDNAKIYKGDVLYRITNFTPATGKLNFTHYNTDENGFTVISLGIKNISNEITDGNLKILHSEDDLNEYKDYIKEFKRHIRENENLIIDEKTGELVTVNDYLAKAFELIKPGRYFATDFIGYITKVDRENQKFEYIYYDLETHSIKNGKKEFGNQYSLDRIDILDDIRIDQYRDRIEFLNAMLYKLNKEVTTLDGRIVKYEDNRYFKWYTPRFHEDRKKYGKYVLLTNDGKMSCFKVTCCAFAWRGKTDIHFDTKFGGIDDFLLSFVKLDVSLPEQTVLINSFNEMLHKKNRVLTTDGIKIWVDEYGKDCWS